MKTVIVTGCSGQLGKEICTQLTNLSLSVVGVDINDDILSLKLNNFTFTKLDITSENEVFSFYNNIISNFENIYGLINNAGVAVFSPFEERNYDELLYVTKVNSFAPIFMTQGFIKVAKKDLNPSIINIASIYGIKAPDQSLYIDTPRNSSEIYGMSKAGIINLTKYLSVYLSKYNIRCNCISPGGVLFKQGPEFIKNYSEKVPLNRMAQVNEIVGSIKFLLDSNSSSYVNGANISIDGGFTSW